MIKLSNSPRIVGRPRRIRGQGMSEYTIIIVVVALGAVAGAALFRDKIKDYFTSTGTKINAVESTAGAAPAAAES